MSYARFSSDDFQSDVYAYMAVHGYVLHLAGNHTVLSDQQLADLGPDPLLQGDRSEEAVQASVERHRKLHQLLDSDDVTHTVIDHPLAGEMLTFDSPGELADKLEELKSEGFHVPKGTIEILREEQADPDAQ